jgi:hypothetical protein
LANGANPRAPWRRISAEIFECPGTYSLTKDSLPAPVAGAHASTRIWLLDTNQLVYVHKSLESNAIAIASPSVWTYDGHPAKIVVGEILFIGGARQQTGIEFDVSARACRANADVTAFLTLTAAFTNASVLTNAISIRTNIAVGARVQIPPDRRLFLITSNAVNGKRMGVIVSATVHEPKK